MSISAKDQAWIEWTVTTSIPMVQLENGNVIDTGSGALIDYQDNRFLVSVEHKVKRESSGWAIVIQQGDKGLEFYRPNSFAYMGEFTRSTSSLRHLDLCFAQVQPALESWYEFRQPRGLFDRRPHHVFEQSAVAKPDTKSTYAFSGQIRREFHGSNAIVTDMVVYPGLKFTHSTDEILHFSLPVPHPGHDFFHGCSGSPIVDQAQRIVALVVRGDIDGNSIQGIAVDRCFPGFDLVLSGNGET